MEIETLRTRLYRRDTTSVLETLDIYSGVRTVLQNFESVIEAPNWTRDGRRLIYNSHGAIWSFDLSTRDSTRIDTGFAIDCNNDHVLAPDGEQLAISHHTLEDGESRIHVLPLQGGSPRCVTERGPSYLHGWSPDGQRLAYCAKREGQFDVYTIDAGGGQEHRLTYAPGLDDGPEYSPDGRHIWFNSTRSGLMQIWRMTVDGEEQTRVLAENANGWFPHVSPDGRWVAYVAYREGDVDPADHPPNKHVELRLLSSSGGSSRCLVQLFGGQGTMNVNSWSPDSRSIAFVSYRPRSS